MPLLLLKDLPKYECLLDAAANHPDLDPSAMETYLHVLRAADETYRVAEDYFNGNGLSLARFTVMMLLLDRCKTEPVARTPAELADMAGVTRATMTGLVNTLERDGLVERHPDPRDGRMLLVRMTARGQEMVSRLAPVHQRRIAAVMAPLDESERRTLVRLLGKVVVSAGARAVGGPTGAEAQDEPLAGAGAATAPTAATGSTAALHHRSHPLHS